MILIDADWKHDSLHENNGPKRGTSFRHETNRDSRFNRAVVVDTALVVPSCKYCWSMVGVHRMTREPGTGKGQFRRHVSFGMRGSSSTQCFVMPLAKNPSNTSLFSAIV